MRKIREIYNLKDKQINYSVMLIVLLVFSGRFKLPLLGAVIPPLIYMGVIFLFLLGLIVIANKDRVLPKDSLTYITLNFVLFLYMVANSFNNTDLIYNIKVLELILYVFPMVVLIFLLLKREKDNEQLVLMIFILTFLFGLMGLLTGSPEETRLSVLGGGSNVYGRFMLFGYIVSLYYLIKSKALYKNALVLGILFIFVILIIQTGSRQAFIGVFLSSFIYLIFYTVQFIRIRKVKVKNVILIGLSTLIIKYYYDAYIIKSSLWNRLLLLFESDKGDSVNVRMTMIEKAQEMFYENPIFGQGTGAFADKMSLTYAYPHNIVYEILAEFGILGILLFFAIILYILVCAFKSYRLGKIKTKSNNLILLYFNLFITSFYFTLVSGNLYDSRWLWFYGTLIVNYLIILRRENVNEIE